jgi:hypothetical protein
MLRNYLLKEVKFGLYSKNGRRDYRSQMRNGIRSEGKSKSNLTITFEGFVKRSIVLQAGSKIDYANPVGPDGFQLLLLKLNIRM